MKREITIAYITSNIAPFRVYLLDSISNYASHVTLFYSNFIDKGVNPQYVSKRPKYAELFCLKELSFLKRLKKILSYNAIVFDGYTGIAKIQIMLACIFLRKKYFISIDGIRDKGECKSNIFKKTLKSFLLSHATFIFSTNFYSDNIIRNIAKNCVISRQIFTTLKREDFLLMKNTNPYYIRGKYNTKGKPTVLFVGKFIKTKGIREILEITNNNNYSFILVGGIEESIKKYNYNKENVTIIPYLEKHDILELMSACDVFVLPTYTDVWGLVIVEALSCGIPVITTDQCNAGLEFIDEGTNGYIIHHDNVTELDFAIKKAIYSLDRQKVREFDAKLMRDYTLEQSGQNFVEALYKYVRPC